MRNLSMKLETEGFATAEVRASSNAGRVSITVDPETQWSAEDLRKLAAMVRASAECLEA